MRPWTALLVLALLAAAAASAQAQPPTFTEAYQLRGAVGDIPTTAAVEPAGTWNLEQRLTVEFDNATEAQHAFNLPAGATLVNATCTCNPSHYEARTGSVLFTLGTNVPSGSYTLTVLTSQGAGDAFGFAINLPIATGPADRIAILYVPTGLEAEAPIAATRSLPSTSGQATILEFHDVPSPFWSSIHPEMQAAEAPAQWNDDLVWFFLALGVVAGASLWSLLVARGVVQKKSRKQVAGTAAHVEAAAAEPPAVLEGRKRALLAALKEIEVAKMNNEMPNDVYDAVKADLKKQAVTVMRALEASSANEPKPAN